jgi:hypothetical protein
MTSEGGQGMNRARREPPSLDGLAAAFAAVPDDPMPGEVWRAAWATCVQLVLVLDVGDRDFDAVPVTPDIDLVDDAGIRVNPSSPLDHPLAAWTRLRRTLPIRVLDVRVSTVNDEDLNAVRDGVGDGAPITSVLDERGQVSDALADRMDEFASATWIPQASNIIDLAAAFRSRNLTPSKVAAELNIAPGDVTDVVRGHRVLGPQHVEGLARLLGVPPEEVPSAPIDEDLIWALDRPRFRRRLADRGAAEGVDDEAAWRYQVVTRLPAAARVTASPDPRRRWMGLIETFLDDER